MHIELIEDPVAFRSQAQAFLASEPLSANVIAVVLARTIDGSLHPTPRDRWIVARDGDEIVGVAMLNEPYNLFASRQPPGAGAALAEAIHRAGLPLPGVTSTAEVSEEVARHWCELTGASAELQIHHQAYRLPGPDSLVAPPSAPGTARLATTHDVAVLAAWLEAFHAEALAHDPEVDNVEVATTRAAAGEIWLWDLAEVPVAMAACSRPTAGVARVGPVYTPPAERGHGYAAGATAATCRAAFAQGAATVLLYADQSNATSNALYRRLGFEPDHEAADYGFRP